MFSKEKAIFHLRAAGAALISSAFAESVDRAKWSFMQD
jgi:hypothetical protein